MDARLGAISARYDLGTEAVEQMRVAKAASDASKLQMWSAASTPRAEGWRRSLRAGGRCC
jgi:hypothetical protein